MTVFFPLGTYSEGGECNILYFGSIDQEVHLTPHGVKVQSNNGRLNLEFNNTRQFSHDGRKLLLAL